MRLRISIRGRVRPSVRPSIPCYFRTTNMAIFEDEKSSIDITNNDTISDDEVVASYVPPRYLFFFLWKPVTRRILSIYPIAGLPISCNHVTTLAFVKKKLLHSYSSLLAIESTDRISSRASVHLAENSISLFLKFLLWIETKLSVKRNNKFYSY